MALYDAQSALDALPEPPEGAPAPAPASLDGQMQWRELCTSIARAADEEKAMLLEELSSVRAELEREIATQAHVDREAQEAEINLNRERAAAEHWRAQHERETEAHDSVQAQIAEIEAQIEGIQMTARGSEKGGAAHLRLRGR